VPTSNHERNQEPGGAELEPGTHSPIPSDGKELIGELIQNLLGKRIPNHQQLLAFGE
jgi:hypothetical protein